MHAFADVVHVGYVTGHQFICNAVEFEASATNENFSAFFLKGFQVFSDLFVFCWQFNAFVHEENVSWWIVGFAKSVEEHSNQGWTKIAFVGTDGILVYEECPVVWFFGAVFFCRSSTAVAGEGYMEAAFNSFYSNGVVLGLSQFFQVFYCDFVVNSNYEVTVTSVDLFFCENYRLWASKTPP